MKALALIAALFAATAGSALAQAPQSLMPVYGITVSASGVTVRVPTGACARKSDFTVAVLKRDPQSMVLGGSNARKAAGRSALAMSS